ncbi:DUF2442 domain-containing protein [bacterium]|nr:DUF2442 domain-containing protein [bacterium]
MKRHHDIADVTIDKEYLKLTIDGIKHSFLLSDVSKKPAEASKPEREKFKVSPSGYGIHWSLIDEDISIGGLVKITHKPNHRLKTAKSKY